MAVRIRQATVLDLDALAEMKDAAWRETYGALVPEHVLDGLEARRPRVVEHWRREMGDGVHFWLAEDAGTVVGLAQAGVARDDDIDVLLELNMLYVLAREHGSGLGRALLKTAIGDMDAYLWVIDGNERAIAFYRKHGFEPDGTSKDVPGMPGPVREIRMVRRAVAD